jgi:proline racemase
LLETGALSLAGRKELRFETPSGVIALEPRRSPSGATAIALTTRPACVAESNATLDAGGKSPTVDLVFSGVFFVLLDAVRNGIPLGRDRLGELVPLGQAILAEANRRFTPRHPEIPEAGPFALALFHQATGPRAARDVVVGRTGAVDRSPCGAGVGALATLLTSRGQLPLGEAMEIEGVIGTRFGARVVEPTSVGGIPASRPEITGTAYLTGFHQFVLDGGDPLATGFLVG